MSKTPRYLETPPDGHQKNNRLYLVRQQRLRILYLSDFFIFLLVCLSLFQQA
jgi:hypothetical protein